MQHFLPLAIRGLLPDHVTSVLFDLCGYFREVSAKVLYISELEKLEERIIMTLCHMEMIFPPGFFTVMVHLVMHLATEAKVGGPVCYRSMWFVERYIGKLKSNVRNRAHPEGSIAEAFLADECMTFCSRYIVGFETKHNLASRNEDDEEWVGNHDIAHGSRLFPHSGNPLGRPRNYVLSGVAKVQAHRYVLFNFSDVNSYLRAHADEITNGRNLNLDVVERIQNDKFHEWFQAHANQVFYVKDELNPGWFVVMKLPKPRDVYDLGNLEWVEETENQSFHVSQLGEILKRKNNDQHWVRTDVEGTIVDATSASSTEE
ncbi:uncharacterized protein LOC123397899 [Hordeum vulgare subsp. vulgare]|uniref:uncharacterized protein LOC123397899 n=1 Tax=Hordeum vulgare subsp. vulgare TaxID=112509 RepID=UPI001D1A46CC|nr:uncharacterized protein LOC123397899 [Hordeum vulgare subsp. vulgare]XP_044948354.1 uncharacterized protein LOC123397899 [Hordeum vulgare subsp. vulgare]XP_044948355.1 uncharacterized protein LOC123397899 [Hordeum vulgare subsp. vulgare]